MISLPHRTLIDLSPVELVRVAAAAGFDAVGFPLIPVRADEPAWRVLEDASVLAAVEAALAETGIGVLDVELVRINPATRAADFRDLFAIGGRLGARFAVAISDDDDEVRVAAVLRALCEEAEPYGLHVSLEFMDRSGIRTLASAQRIVAAAAHPHAGLLVDAGHLYRSGATYRDLAGVDPRMLQYMQINDVAQTVEPWTKVVPGDGDVPLAELMAALPAGIPVSLEVSGPTSGKQDAAAYARRACAATRRIVSA